MNWKSWWNGFLTLLETITVGGLVKSIWIHDLDAIMTLTLVFVVFGVFWLVSAGFFE